MKTRMDQRGIPWQWILTIALTDLDFLLRSAQICKKMHYFPQLKDHNSGRKKEIRQMTPFFSCTFWALMTCDIHFCIWKLLKFIFMGSLLWSIQKSAKYQNFHDESCQIRILSHSIQETYTLSKVKNQICLI